MFDNLQSISTNVDETNPHEICSFNLLNSSFVTIQAGSVLDFIGDAMVNAANNGGFSGFGLDEMVNRAAGNFEIKEARKEFGGILTGEAKYTSSFKHTKVKHIIHAVGPVYRENRLGKSISITDLDDLLVSAYKSSLRCAMDLNATSVGFCLLSAGVFRGEKPLEEVIMIAIRTLIENIGDPIKNVVLYAFSVEEQECCKAVVERLVYEFNSTAAVVR